MVRALHIFWGLGVAAWNAIGLYRVQYNEAPIGPTASMAVGFLDWLLH